MGLDNLPSGYDAWRTRTPYDDVPDHLPECPCSEDYQPAPGVEGCEFAECTCPTSDELKAEAAEARADLDREDHI